MIPNPKVKKEQIMKYLNRIKAQDENLVLEVMEDAGRENIVDPVAGMLQAALIGEYQQWDLYTAYASRLKGEARSPIADEFKDHADEEAEHIETLQRYLVSMGAVPTLHRKPLPALPGEAALEDILHLQLAYEKEAVALYEKMLGMLEEDQALKLDIENILVKEQEHVHDLELLIQKPALAGLMFCHEEPGEPTRPQAGYGCDCGSQCKCKGQCQCGGHYTNKINNHWSMIALQEMRPDIYARWQQGHMLTEEEKNFVAQALCMKLKLGDKRAVLRFLENPGTK